jgi:two-component system, OmpR family, sensor histidine kinase KdpD
MNSRKTPLHVADFLRNGSTSWWPPYIWSLGIVCIALGLSMLTGNTIGLPPSPRLFLVGVLICAVNFGLGPALLASLFSLLAYDFFMLPPFYSLRIGSTGDLIDFSLFGVFTVIITAVSVNFRGRAASAAARALVSENLAQFNRTITDQLTLTDLADAAAAGVGRITGMTTAIVFFSPTGIEVAAGHSTEDTSSLSQAAAEWLLTESNDRSQVILNGWRLVPMRDDDRPFGLLCVRPNISSDRFEKTSPGLLAALADQTALALERLGLRNRLAESRIKAEAERLRDVAINAINHDLRNPIASIVTATGLLAQSWETMADADRRSLTVRVHDGAVRLDGLLGKLVDMTRINAGTVPVVLEHVEVADIIDLTVRDAETVTAGRNVLINIQTDLPCVTADFLLLKQCLFNVLENAGKYTPPRTRIWITAAMVGPDVVISIADEGPGIAAGEEERIFEKYYRSTTSGEPKPGRGLGLSVSRGLLTAMGGSIRVRSMPGGGAIFLVTVPIAKEYESCLTNTP